MIRIKCGTCGTSQGYKTPATGPLSLSISEEARLVARGVAEYVTVPVKETNAAVATANSGQGDGGVGTNTPDGKKPAEALEAPEWGHLDEAQLMTMGLKTLKGLAEDMGVDTDGLRTKKDYAKAIAAVEVIAGEELAEDDGEVPPNLAPENPVE